MDEVEIAKQKLLSAALTAAAGQISRESNEPGPYDDAQAELENDMLDEAAVAYVTLRRNTNG